MYYALINKIKGVILVTYCDDMLTASGDIEDEMDFFISMPKI
jgi:hypothetical protein